MKKTLLLFLFVYIVFLLIGFAASKYAQNRGIDPSLADRATERKLEMLENSFVLAQGKGSPTFSVDVLEISNYVLSVEDVVVGGGNEALPGDIITIHYAVSLEDGDVFDSSRSPGRSPFQFELGSNHVVEGLDEGIIGMRVGGTRMIHVPPSKAYGLRGFGPVPGGATLVYEVELLSVFE